MIRAFQENLLRWYRRNARDLPWRQTRDPYKIWISEVMLQQTTVATVIPYYGRWVKAFPTMRHVARAPLGRVLKMWQGLGYYQRARNIHRSAKAMVERFAGKIPEDPAVLRTLPGFGPYTAHAVLSIAYDQRLSIVDANVRRVGMRLLALRGEADTSQDEPVRVFLEKVLPSRGVCDFNQALMELGALVCRPDSPLCAACPLTKSCIAFERGIQEEIPAVRKKKVHRIEAVCGVLMKGRFYYIQKRPSEGLLGGLWEFPGGKVEKGESARQALARELKEELGISFASAKPMAVIRHAYTKFQVRLHVWSCDGFAPAPPVDRNHRWVDIRQLKKIPVPSATAKIINACIEGHI
jgi:A/G-specific adenine glycosylase